MNREYHCWYSPRLQRQMELLVFGNAGARLLVFPTRDGRFFEFENLGLVDSLAAKIEAGQLQVWCVDGIDQETFYCAFRQPEERIRRHMLFEDYILHEVMPQMQAKNPCSCTIAHGNSLGAFHAANIAFRHPQLFRKLLACSGRYDLTLEVEAFHDLFNGYYDENIYFNTPTHFLPGLEGEEQLQALRRMDIVIVIGDEDPFLHNNYRLSEILNAKGIGHQLIVWAGRAHRGRYWREMVSLYL